MDPSTVQIWSSLISSVGFPIVMCIFLMQFLKTSSENTTKTMDNTLQQLNTTTQELKQTVEKQTVLIDNMTSLLRDHLTQTAHSAEKEVKKDDT